MEWSRKKIMDKVELNKQPQHIKGLWTRRSEQKLQHHMRMFCYKRNMIKFKKCRTIKHRKQHRRIKPQNYKRRHLILKLQCLLSQPLCKTSF